MAGACLAERYRVIYCIAVRCCICGLRRSRRYCLAKSAAICSNCCGTGRLRSIVCLSTCNYLQAARREALGRLLSFGGDPDFEADWYDVLGSLRQAAARVLRRQEDGVGTGALLAALANAAETARTRSVGLIYEFRSPDPLTQGAADELMAAVHDYTGRGDRCRQVGFVDIAMCLRYLHRQVAEAIRRGARADTLAVLFELTGAGAVRTTTERLG